MAGALSLTVPANREVVDGGLEARSPLINHYVIEFCARMRSSKVRNRVGKYLLKKPAQRYFPTDFVHRPKMGFGIPLAAWLRGPLRKVVLETLLNERLMAPLSGAVIERTLHEFESGLDGHESRFWSLLMFGGWRVQRGEGEDWRSSTSKQWPAHVLIFESADLIALLY